MDLIHCHRCGILPALAQEPQRQRYYMTSCAHLFCEPCVRSFTDRCPQCQNNCSVAELSGQSNPEVKAMFSDPIQVLKDAMNKPMRILSFQKQLNKDKIKIMGKMMTTLAAARSESTMLKSETARLRQLNEEMANKIKELEAKNNDLQLSRNVSPIQQVYALNVPGHGGDSSNLFRDPMERPNAQVQPMVQPHPQHSTTPFSLARSPQSVISLGSSTSPFSQSRPSGGFSRVHVNLSPHSTPVSGSSLFNNSGSASRTHHQSPFFRQQGQGNSAGNFGAGAPGMHTPVSTSGSSVNKTPDLINRLRNMKCVSKLTPPPLQSPRY